MKVTEDVTTLMQLTSEETTMLRIILATAPAPSEDISRFARRLHDVLVRVTLPKVLTLREEEDPCFRSISKDSMPSGNGSALS